MNIAQSFRLALKSLATSKMRALLTMLGIIIGVAAVIIIISLGDGMQAMINEQFEAMGTNSLRVTILGRGSSRNVTAGEMYAVREENPDCIAAMSPNVSVTGSVKVSGETLSTSVAGVGEDYRDMNSLELERGRFIQYIDILRLQKVCVIGSYVNGEYFNGDGLGKSLYLNGNEYKIVGVLAEQADNASSGNDNYIYIPYTNATRLNGNANISSFVFTSVSDETNSKAKGVIEEALKKIYGDDSNSYLIISMSEMMDAMGTISDTVMTVLVAIAAISLLVGGIGIMNIMLVSVTERTREIGIRKSLGAKGKDIRSQFIIEAGATSALGGLIGIILGVSLAGVIGSAMDITAQASLSAICISAGVSLAVGVIFGYLPANKAAKLNPIDALRYE